MDSLERNNTTAAQAMQLEDGAVNPLRPRERHTAAYFRLLAERRKLPISAKRQEFLDVYHESSVTILTSDTGTGKTTQVPQFILFDEWESGLAVACTQPRRIAATSVAKRVAEEMDVPLGQEVGYGVRFDKKSSDVTRLRYLTDGLLLREALGDPKFSKYSCVVLDEAHERTKATDLLMALLKKAVASRADLKLVIISATMNAEKFKAYFPGAKTLDVRGRTHPVDIQYLAQETPDYPSCALRTVIHIHKNMDAGDILVFLPSISEIERFCADLRRITSQLVVFTLHSGLPEWKEKKVFKKCLGRKCIVATNFAETSVTIDGIVYVVDTGLVIQNGFNPRAGLNQLFTSVISKASATQRAGRAGRTRPGVCFRLYTEETYQNDLPPFAPPGILTSELSAEILMLKAMGFHAAYIFDFLDRPHPEVYFRALEDLLAIGYLDASSKITAAGRRAMKLPLHPVWYSAIAEAHKIGCCREMVAVAALSAAQSQHSVLTRPHTVRYAADAARPRFAHPQSDHLAQLNALHAYVKVTEQGLVDMDDWCRNAFLNRNVLEEALRTRDQILCLVKGLFGSPRAMDFLDPAYEVKIRKALARSFYYHSAIRDGDNDEDLYRTVHGNHPAGIHPGSSLVGAQHEWVVYESFTHSAKQYLQAVTAVEPEWLVDLPHFQDDKLARKRNGPLRQPYVKSSLDRARDKAAQRPQ